jgi:hypothetical protein
MTALQAGRIGLVSLAAPGARFKGETGVRLSQARRSSVKSPAGDAPISR